MCFDAGTGSEGAERQAVWGEYRGSDLLRGGQIREQAFLGAAGA